MGVDVARLQRAGLERGSSIPRAFCPGYHVAALWAAARKRMPKKRLDSLCARQYSSAAGDSAWDLRVVPVVNRSAGGANQQFSEKKEGRMKECLLSKSVLRILASCISLSLSGCSAFVPWNQQLTVLSSEPDADILVNGQRVGSGQVTTYVAAIRTWRSWRGRTVSIR